MSSIKISSLKKPPTEEALWQKMQALLARRAHSEQELIQKLKSHFDETQIHQALKKARKNNWLEPPEDMALRLIEELNRKKKGWLYIQSALRKRGLPLLPKEEEKEREKARWWLSKKESTNWDNPKIYRFLMHRGFEVADIKTALKEYKTKKDLS